MFLSASPQAEIAQDLFAPIRGAPRTQVGGATVSAGWDEGPSLLLEQAIAEAREPGTPV
jgi:hypothetical protein